MKEFEKLIRKRMLTYNALCILACILELITQFIYRTCTNPTATQNFLSGFISGLLAFVAVFAAVHIVNYSKLLKDEIKLKQQYHLEHDEREQLIRLKSASLPLKGSALFFLVIGCISAFWNETIFFTLLGCCVFLLLLHKALRLYYKRQY